jgi:hypothetical protein
MDPFYEIKADDCVVNRLCVHIEEVIVEESNIVGKFAEWLHFFRDELECCGNANDVFIS